MGEENGNRNIPNWSLSVLLFLFFYQITRTFFDKIHLILEPIVLEASEAESASVLYNSLANAVYFVLLALSVWSIIRMLKNKPDGVACMIWALALSLVDAYQFLSNNGWKGIEIHWGFNFTCALQILLAVVFLAFIFLSKSIKRYSSVDERRFAPGGWVWLLFFVFCVGLNSYNQITSWVRTERSKEIPVNALKIPDGCYSDGKILFKSALAWERKKTEFDLEGEKVVLDFFVHADDSAEVAYVVINGVSSTSRHRDFRKVMLAYLPYDDTIPVREGNICDTVIDGNQYYIEQYIFDLGTISALWTFSMRFDVLNFKWCALSRMTVNGPMEDEFENSIRFLKSVEFDLTSYRR